MAELSKEKLQDFQMLLNITSGILNSYKELSVLEENNQKASIQYENTFNNLKSDLAIEANIRSRLTGSISDIDQLLEFLKEFYDVENPTRIFSTVTKDEKYLIQRRILNKFIFDLLERRIKEGYPDVASFLGSNIDFEALGIDVKALMKCVDNSNLYILTDLFSLSYTIMNENAPSWVKYVLAFQIPSCETEAINNCFQVNSNPYLIHPLVFSMFPDKDLVNEAFSTFINGFFHRNLGYMLNFSNYELNSEEQRLACIHYSTLLRAALVLSLDSDKKVSEIESVIKQYEGDYNYGFLCKTLKDILNNMEKDKIIPIAVSMGR